jgi:hypothetical protein
VESPTRRNLILAALVLTVAAAGRIEQTGTFVLLGGTPKIVSKFWTDHAQGLTATLKVRQFQIDGKTPILDYDVDMQHLMHLVVVRDDFATFAHLHPVYDTTTGTFQQPFTKQANHAYYVYADSVPHGIGQQVFRFTLAAAGPVSAAKPSLSASVPNAHAGPYIVILQKTTIAANTPQSMHLTIVSGDDPATDLVPYLGEPAHCVLISTSTLQYIHVHPMLRGSYNPKATSTSMERQMTGPQKAGPFMKLDLPALPAGTYKTWIQIAGGGALHVYTASFTIVAQ